MIPPRMIIAHLVYKINITQSVPCESEPPEDLDVDLEVRFVETETSKYRI